MTELDPEIYGIDPTDGLPFEKVGPWVVEKHTRLTKFIDISRGVRRQFVEGPSEEASFIDLYCGPGRAQIRGVNDLIDGGCVAAWKKSVEGKRAFTKVVISDARPSLASAAATRLANLAAPTITASGLAEDVVDHLVAQLNPYGLHFAYLDPYNLNALPFSVIRTLAKLRRIDILMHISVYDLQRNAGKYTDADKTQFDRFAPGWRENVTMLPNQQAFRAKLFEYWRRLIRDLGIDLAEGVELVTSDGGQRLYWLAFASRNSRAHEFWDKIREIGGQGDLF